MDPRKAASEWFYSTVFRDETIRPRTAPRTERLPPMLCAARSLENGCYQSWQSRESVFMKQAKLLANYEDDCEDCGDFTCYYPTYQSLTDRQLRSYFSWRTGLRRGDVQKAPLSFAFLYIYELINQIGVTDPLEGYRKLEAFGDTYGRINSSILPYLRQWLADYVVYYGLDRDLLADSPQAMLDRCTAVLDQVREREPSEIIGALKPLSKWLRRSKFYAEHPDDMEAVIVQVLRKVSAHCAARCKRTMVEQYFGLCGYSSVRLFETAVFCDPLKRRNYQYTLDEQCVYSCQNGLWSVWGRGFSADSVRKIDDLLKTVDSVMRQEFHDRHPVKAELSTKWILQLIREETQDLIARRRAAEEKKVTIRYADLARIRRDAAVTQEKLTVEETDLPEEPAPEDLEPTRSAQPSSGTEDMAGSPLDPAEYRLVQCLLYGRDTGWVQAEGLLLSVLADGINEKLYDLFLDCVLDGTPQLVEDYIPDLKEMVRP